MTKQVALADQTYLRLRAARRPGESFSQAIDRLLDSAKDPRGFLRAGRSRNDPDRWIEDVRADRDDSTVDA